MEQDQKKHKIFNKNNKQVFNQIEKDHEKKNVIEIIKKTEDIEIENKEMIGSRIDIEINIKI